MKKAIEISMLITGLTIGITALADFHNSAVRNAYSERYIEGYDRGEKYGRMMEGVDVLYELANDGMITVDTYNKYVKKYWK